MPSQSHQSSGVPDHLTQEQGASLPALCVAFHVEYNPDYYRPKLQFPMDYAASWIDDVAIRFERKRVYVNVSPERMASIR